jgi:hypothetical protein
MLSSQALALRMQTRHLLVMRDLISLIIGAVALLLVVLAFIPLAVIGLAFGAMSDKTSGRNLNIVVIAVGALRLFLGGGIL